MYAYQHVLMDGLKEKCAYMMCVNLNDNREKIGNAFQN